MPAVTEPVLSSRCYFVDEAGDGTLFNSAGKEIIGTEGCSRFFILGVLHVRDVDSLEKDLIALRDRIVADPYLAGIASVQKSAFKTAKLFHATDDAPEVRDKVFGVLRKQDVRFQAVVREKADVLAYVKSRRTTQLSYHYHPDELYDFLARSLFRNLLHKDAAYQVTFSKRGKNDRTKSLMAALESARQNFEAKYGIQGTSHIQVYSRATWTCLPLQAVDYFLWALQRLFEKGEDRYVQFLWPRFELIHDLDDQRRNVYGEYYTKERPLNRAALQDRPGI